MGAAWCRRLEDDARSDEWRSELSLEYDQTVIEEFIKEHLDNLHLKGEEYRSVCPFCKGGENNEVSFYVNPSKGVANCYRAVKCNWSGTVIKLIKDVLNVSWVQAYKIAGGEPPDDMDEIIGLANRRASALMGTLADAVASRGVVKSFPSDAIPLDESDRFDEVCEWLSMVRGFDPDEFMYCHELYTSNQHYFRGRVLFKVTSEEHETYLAYAYDPTLDRKTLNPPGAELSRMLFNYDDARNGEYIFVCEGIFDAARLVERGLNAVAIFGTNLSLDQVFLLGNSSCDEIIICLDHGTVEASNKIAKMLGQYITNKRISVIDIDVPDADPDILAEEDFIRCFHSRRVLLKEGDKAAALLNSIG